MLLIEILTLKSIGLQQSGETAPALGALEEAVTRSEPEGIVRPVLDAGLLAPGVLDGLLAALKRKSPACWEYVDILLAALLADQPTLTPGAEPSRPAHALLEPLSERELEVLRLLAAGLTNPQIAARLVITTGTVKAHTANIFRKLDAANRTQAVSIAREIRLVE